MLSFRMVLITVACGLCLWGLFSLLDNLNEPGLLRSEKAVVVKGCDALDDAQTQQLCPPLLCQKALFDAHVFPRFSTVNVAIDKSGGAERLIAGRVHDGPAPKAGSLGHFLCIAQRGRILLARSATDKEIADAAQLDGDWSAVVSATMEP